jgi:hypothetical protein
VIATHRDYDDPVSTPASAPAISAALKTHDVSHPLTNHGRVSFRGASSEPPWVFCRILLWVKGC